MSGDPRQLIVKEAVKIAGFDRGVALLGILFDYRIVLSLRHRSISQGTAGQDHLEPLDPQAAANVVSSIFKLDPDVAVHFTKLTGTGFVGCGKTPAWTGDSRRNSIGMS